MMKTKYGFCPRCVADRHFEKIVKPRVQSRDGDDEDDVDTYSCLGCGMRIFEVLDPKFQR
ncbi:MAG: hypothetical protein Q7S36_01190 [Candidatus Liptonbacteria bacterium]|nr:hypothetical protein [Candidatus Liptonbacteria bacterium]